MVTKKKLIQIMDNYNLNKIVISPQVESNDINNYQWLHNIFPDLDILKYRRKFRSISNNKIENAISSDVYSELVEYAKDHADRFKIIFTTSIDSGNILHTLIEEHKKSKFSAIKINNFFNTIDFESTNFSSILQFCKINSIPIFVYVYRKSESKQLYQLAAKNPAITFVLASMSGIEYFEYFTELPANMMCELCNLNLVSDVRLLNAINTFGADKVFFSFEADKEKSIDNYIKRIMKLSIPDSSKTLILSSNINKIFK